MKKTLATASIRLDSGTQCRVSINSDAVTEYTAAMQNGDKFPPVDVFWDGTEYHCADGFHRLLAAGRAGIKEFSANVHNGTVDDALWFAISANRSNGVARTSSDKRKAIELALVKFPDKTQQAIAEHVGCTRQYVAKVSSELATSCKLRLPATRKGKDGKDRPTTYAKRKPVEPAPEPEPARDIADAAKPTYSTLPQETPHLSHAATTAPALTQAEVALLKAVGAPAPEWEQTGDGPPLEEDDALGELMLGVCSLAKSITRSADKTQMQGFSRRLRGLAALAEEISEELE